MSSDDAKTVAEPAGTAESERAPSTEPATAAPAAGPETARRPKQRRMRDMALSLAVLLVPLGLFYWVWDWAATGREVSVVDTSQDYLAAESLGLETVEPELSQEWKAVSSALATEEEAVTLRTGWYSPDGHGMQLVQTTGPAEAVHDELTGPGEAVEAGGLEWAAYDIAEGRAWVAVLDVSTVVLTADRDAVDELPELAEGVAAGLER